MHDREAQARLRDAQAKKDTDLSDALDLYNGGGFEKMTAAQRSLVARMVFQQQTLMSNREKTAAAALAKANQLSTGVDDPDVKKAQAEYDDAKNDYDDATQKYNELTGNTPGIQLANKIIRSGVSNLNWADVDKQIKDNALPVPEQDAAKAKVWNTMSPAQQAAAKKQVTAPTQTSGHKEGDEVTLKNGQRVIIKKMNPDGTFEY